MNLLKKGPSLFGFERYRNTCIHPWNRVYSKKPDRISVGNKNMSTSGSFLSVEAEDFASLSDCLDWCRGNSTRDAGPTYVFFCHTLCPYAERVWLALLEEPQARERFVLVHVDLSNKPRWYLENVHPRGLVPSVLVDDGGRNPQVLIESIDICMWILGTKEGVGRDVDIVVSAALEAIGGNGRYWGIGTNISKRQRDDFEDACKTVFHPSRCLSQLESIALFPFMYRAWVAMKSAYGIDIFLMDDGRVGVWMENMMLSRESTKITCAAEDALAGAFQRHKSLDFFDYVSYGIFDLHPHMTSHA